jgi:RND family efflux transporter MFP subunit
MPPNDASHAQSHSTSVAPGDAPKRRGLMVAGLAILIVGGAIVARFVGRAHAERILARATLEAAVPSVNVIHPQAGAPNQEIALPGYTQAFTDTPVYARTSGYLKIWRVDIGARVKKGDLLAEIETPEVDQQLRQARADLATARANLNLAVITAERNESLLKTRSVSTQDRDNAEGALAADKAIVESNEGNVGRLEQLQSYEKIYAPFDGIVTARNTDIGALVDAGANSPSKELFHLAAIDTLRVYVSVPESYSRAAHPGATANLTLDEFPGESFHGTLVRNSNAIELSSRTLLVEVDVDNRAGRLLPGAYTFVHLSLPTAVQSVTLPSNTLIFRKEGLRAAVVRNGHAQLVALTIGRDYGEKVEILSGLEPSDEVISDPSDSLVSGTAVLIAGSKSE